MSVRRLVVLALVTLTAVLLVASPAVASQAAAAPVADDQYKWFYWAAPLLTLAAIGVIGALGFGYYVRVIRPKHRGRKVS